MGPLIVTPENGEAINKVKIMEEKDTRPNKLLRVAVASLCSVCVKYLLVPLSYKLTELEMELRDEI